MPAGVGEKAPGFAPPTDGWESRVSLDKLLEDLVGAF
jgi:hypothetical protein